MWSKSRFKCTAHVCRSLAPLAAPLWNSTGGRQDTQQCLMAVALLTTYIHALLLCVLLALTLQLSTSRTALPGFQQKVLEGKDHVTDCGAPKTVENTEVKPYSETNLQYIRYRCLDGYKRKAGTSNLAICVVNSTTKTAYWKYGKISCIRDPSLPMTTHSTLTSLTTSRDPSLAMTTHSTLTSPTTSYQQHYTAFPTTGASTINIIDTTSSTTSGSQSTTMLPTTEGKATVRTTTQRPGSSEHAATSRKTTQTVPESTYISTNETPKLSTISYNTTTGNDSSIQDTSLWQQEKTIGSIFGALLLLILLGICIVFWIKCRNQHSQVPQEEPNQNHDYSADQEELAEESRDL